MGTWILDFVLVAVAVLLMGVAVYKLMFSAEGDAQDEALARPRPRFERRDVERTDRRQIKGLAPGGIERRIAQRR